MSGNFAEDMVLLVLLGLSKVIGMGRGILTVDSKVCENRVVFPQDNLGKGNSFAL